MCMKYIQTGYFVKSVVQVRLLNVPSRLNRLGDISYVTKLINFCDRYKLYTDKPFFVSISRRHNDNQFGQFGSSIQALIKWGV